MNNYRVQHPLTQTVYGDVLVARVRKAWNKKVAIKRNHLASARAHLTTLVDGVSVHENAFVERRVNCLVSRAPHPNIVRLLGEFEEDGYMHLIFEYRKRGDLFTWLEKKRGKGVRLHRALRFFQQIVDGLRYLHCQGYAHRDLSLENVLLSSKRICQLTDFGLAVPLASRPQETVGKAFYMAPEVQQKGLRYDPSQADMWSLGVMLYILLTGEALMAEASMNDANFRYLSQHGVASMLHSAKGLRQDVPDHIIDLLNRLLCVSPQHRIRLHELEQSLKAGLN